MNGKQWNKSNEKKKSDGIKVWVKETIKMKWKVKY